MKVVTTQDHINNVAKHWKHQYCKKAQWGPTVSGDSRLVHERLVALGDIPSKADIDAIIGNTSWTQLYCKECLKEYEQVINFRTSKHPYYLCQDCLKRAVERLTT